MKNPYVAQLHFARSAFQRCLEGVSEQDALVRVGPINSLGWMVGHLANQEQRYWVMMAQGELPFQELNERVGTGKPASTPPLSEMWEVWRQVTTRADAYLNQLDRADLRATLEWEGQPAKYNVGMLLLRNTYHYWFHTGEAYAVRQGLGHHDLPEFVGDMSWLAEAMRG
jgi:DinB superfamily